MKKLNLTLADILRLAYENPNGTQLTSEIREYTDEDGNIVKEFLILA